MIELTEMEKLVGYAFAGGSYTVEPYEHWLTCDVVLAPPTFEGVAHPLYVYMAALAGMGLSVDGLFRLCHATAADGPMFGECGTEIIRPLLVGGTYDVQGGITGVVRKTGQRTGTFDIVSFRLELVDGLGVAAVSRNSFVFPRRSL